MNEMKNKLEIDGSISAKAAANTKWDVIIVGAGMGGSAAAYSLAREGLKILVLEKGFGKFENDVSVTREENDPISRMNSGRWPTKLSGVVDGSPFEIWPPLGSGVGGSTLLYGAALHRLRPQDFEAQQLPDGNTVEWPFLYDELAPYYQRAEELLSVRGTVDPLQAQPDFDLPEPEPMCERDQFFFDEFSRSGLHPYSAHTSISYLEGCNQCPSKICVRKCRREANNSFLEPALGTNNVSVCCRVDVEKINADQSRVQSVTVRQDSEVFVIEAKTFILAAGGYSSPVILLRSISEHWPTGLANNNDLVGRNLMFHGDCVVAYWAPKELSKEGPTKTIALRDFYRNGETNYGEFQSTGMIAEFGNILYSLRLSFDQSRFRRIPFVRQLLRIPAYFASKFFGEATIFAIIVEDFAYPDNRVVVDNTSASGFYFTYNIREELRTRMTEIRALARKRVKRLRSMVIGRKATLNFGHPCGTCKAGTDPQTSVLDRNCKPHGLENLYVLDSSFMPTSGGTNPSLTIAANSLRVAAIIGEDLNNRPVAN